MKTTTQPSKKRESGWLERELATARAQSLGRLRADTEACLRDVLVRTGLRISRRELLLIDGSVYVSHGGLLRLAQRQRCAGIHTEVVAKLSRPSERSWVVQATVFKHARSAHGFLGLGDADPTNVSPRVRGAELRVAETRAVNRALRKAYAIGLCSAEEISGRPEEELERSRLPHLRSTAVASAAPTSAPLRITEVAVQDRLKLILRDHELEPAQVLKYACRFLNVADLTSASREELAGFANHLEQFAIANRTWLLAELSRAAAGTDNKLRQSRMEEAA